MKHPIRRFLLASALAATASVAWADGLQALESFLQNVGSARASFTQTVTAPPRSGEATPRVRASSGSFAFQRPDRFRFDYAKPFPQVIVADGQTLWLHDIDLNQVTARSQKDALGSTPAALIASAKDLKSLSAAFELRAAPDRDGMSWVEARPRQADGQLRLIRLGLQGGQIAAMDIEDGLGQRSQIRFQDWRSNPGLGAADFRFTPPPGADVIRP
jgi:outer membrane lipoprotein carrier protein